VTSWLYLALGFALFFLLLRGKRRESPTALWAFYLALGIALTLLLAIDTFANVSLWLPTGRSDLRLVSIFLWALVIEGAAQRIQATRRPKGEIQLIMSPFFLTLFAFALWTVTGVEGLLARERFFWGLALPVGTAFFEWLLEGLRERLRLLRLPPGLEGAGGAPIIFWLAMLLALSFAGLRFF
jgi:hypothetical protein